MADDGRAARKPAAEKDETKKPTQRVVLRRERVIVLPDTVDEDTLGKLSSGDGAKALAALLGLGSAKVPTVCIGAEAWTVVGEFVGSTKDKAIEAYAGKAGTPDAKVGDFKAPGSAAWAGGLRYSAPPKPLVEKESIE
jgi:hypothetical protein